MESAEINDTVNNLCNPRLGHIVLGVIGSIQQQAVCTFGDSSAGEIASSEMVPTGHCLLGSSSDIFVPPLIRNQSELFLETSVTRLDLDVRCVREPALDVSCRRFRLWRRNRLFWYAPRVLVAAEARQ